MRKTHLFAALLVVFVALTAEDCNRPETTDQKQQQQQEQILAEGNAKTGMPSITNFRERKLLRDILEKRDKADYVTYTYVYSEMTGKFTFFCESIGYPIPYATQYTSPQKLEGRYMEHMYVIPQADPNGLFSPASADGTWVLCKDPNSKRVEAVYVEPKVTTSPFRLQ